jgi:RNA polymerase primary sigma factor
MIDINEEIELSHKIKDGDSSAAKKLVEGNLRFIISVAKQYQNKGIPLVDLIQSGVEGAMKAAYLWDETRGFKFISYAVWWIRQAIMQSISSECRTVRLPMNYISLYNKINKVSEKFEQQELRNPSVEEIEELSDLPNSKISATLSSGSRSVSFDTPFKDEEAGTLLDVIPNENAENSDLNVIQSSVSKEIEIMIDSLPDRERDILRMTFGIGMVSMQFKEIASRFGIGYERARQIECEALAKIKSKYGDELRELL